MSQVSLLVIEVVLLIVSGGHYLALYRVRREPMVRRSGTACLVFAAYVAAHAWYLAVSKGHDARLAGTVVGLAAVSLVPIVVSLSDSLHSRERRFVRMGYAYAIIGGIGLWLHQFGVRPGALDQVVDLGTTGRPPHLVEDLVAGGYALAGLLLCVAASVRLGFASVQSPSLRPSAWAHAFAIACGLHDLHLNLFAQAPGSAYLDVGLVLIIATGIDGNIRRIARSGDALQTQTEALARSYAELRATQERLVRNEQLAAVGELSAVIAHEVRNPLAIIKNALSGLRRKSLGPNDRLTLLDILDEETDRLNRLMHDLLAYARPVAPQLGSVPVEDLLRRSVERAFGGVSAPRGLEVTFALDPDTPNVEADPDLLVHAFVNVIENALQAMPNGGTLTLRSRVTSRAGRPTVAIDISDTGEGMDTAVRTKARNPFFTTRPTGTGLGLAIVERVVRNHGGQVEITSGHGQGTTVAVYLPLDRSSLHPLPIPESSSRTLVFPRGEAP